MKASYPRILKASMLLGTALSVSVRPVVADAPADGKWDDVLTLPFQPIHMVLLRDKQVLAVGGQDKAPNPCLLYNATNGMSSSEFYTPNVAGAPENAQHNLFCSGHAALPDGRIVFNGGSYRDFGNKTTIYDPAGGATTEAFEVLAEVSPAYRFYPTLTALADGRLLAMAGHAKHDPSQSFRTPALFDVTRPPGLRWKTLPGAEYCTSDLTCPTNNFYLHFYPFMFQLSDGELLYAGEGKGSRHDGGAWRAG